MEGCFGFALAIRFGGREPGFQIGQTGVKMPDLVLLSWGTAKRIFNLRL